MAVKKNYNIQVFSKDGATHLKTLAYNPTEPTDGSKDPVLLSEPIFTAQKNGGLGACNLEFNLKIDDFGVYSTAIQYMNEFRIWEISDKHPLGKKVYSGYLNDILPRVEKGRETVSVELLGYSSVFTFDEFRTSGGSDTVSYTATDPAVMAQDIVTRISELYPQLNWDSASIPLTGKSEDYDFVQLTWLESIDIVQKILGVNYYFYVDQENKVYLLEKSTEADHKYIMGKEVLNLSDSKPTDTVFNRILFEWSGGTIEKTDSDSITEYNQRTKREPATNITDSTAAEIQAQYLLDSLKDPKNNSQLTLGSKASFWNVRPGQTINIQGLRQGQTIFGDNMQIAKMRYSADTLILDLESYKTISSEILGVTGTETKY